MADTSADKITTFLHTLRSRFATWTRSGRAPAFLLTSQELVDVESMFRLYPTFKDSLTPALAEFIEASGRYHVSEAYRSWLQAGRMATALMDDSSLRLAEGWAARLPTELTAALTEEIEFIKLNRAFTSPPINNVSRDRNVVGSQQASKSVVGRETPIETSGDAERRRRQAERQHKEEQRAEKERARRDAQVEKRRKVAVAASKLDTLHMQASFEAPDVDPGAHRLETADLVDVSVFAPSRTCRGSEIIVQVMLHAAGAVDVAATRAGLIDETAVLRGTSSLQVDLKRGTRVTISLSEPLLAIEQPSQAAIWNGQLTSISILVFRP